MTVLLSFCWSFFFFGGGDDKSEMDRRRKHEKAHLDEGSYDAKGGETKVFKGTRFGSCIQERIKKERYMRYDVASLTNGCKWEEGGKYRSRRAVLSRDEMRRIEGERERCRRG